MHQIWRILAGAGALVALLSATACGAGPAIEAARGPAGALGSQALANGAGYVVDRTIAGGIWSRIERLSDAAPNFPTERSRPNGKQFEPEIVDAFGTATPPSSQALLHYMPGWDAGTGSVVLLVHGSCADADTSWVHPLGRVGLAPTLAAQGFRVFAITFAHRNGDNLLQVELLADAIDRIRKVTGAASIDLVAHSKGGIVARALVSHMAPPGMPGYQGGLHRLILVGTPNLGIDYTFRHPLVDYGLYPEQSDYLRNVPMAWNRMFYLGLWTDTSALTMDKDAGNYFPGLEELQHRWDAVYPLNPTRPDWYTTYYGGQGLVSASEGIDQAISESGDFIDQLQAHPVDPAVQLGVIAGDRADIPQILNENDGPSDGLIFVRSALATDAMTRAGAKLIARTTLPLNHVDLISTPLGMEAISALLKG